MHAGRQDVALLRRELGCEVSNVFDTQVAAGFAGLGAQASYDSLLTAVLGLRVAKTASFTRWDARPLSAEQIAYAREDVVHLLDLAAELEAASVGARPAAVGARGVRAAEPRQRRARPAGDLRAAAAGRRPERLGTGRSRASWSSGASRRPRARTGPCRGSSATRRSSRSPGADRPPARTSARIRGIGASASGRRAQDLLDAVCASQTAARRSRPRRVRGPLRRSRRMRRWWRSAETLVRARGRARRAWPTSCWRPARTCRRSSLPSARAPSAADVRTLRGWRARARRRGPARAAGRSSRAVCQRLRGPSPHPHRARLRERKRLMPVPAIRCGCRLRTAAGTSRSR